jgi:glucan phosphoethanolaminetransferase (alkaline phosphatase superfamily)
MFCVRYGLLHRTLPAHQTPDRGLSRPALFFAALVPALAWFVAGMSLAHPGQTLFWSMACATTIALVPWPRVGALLLLLCLPLTLIWTSSVLLTGSGPTTTLVLAAATATPREIATAFAEAVRTPAVVVLGLLQVAAVGLAWRVTRGSPSSRSGPVAWLFVVAVFATLLARLGPEFGLAQTLRWMGPEAWRSVAWLSHVEVVRSAAQEGLDRLSHDGRSFVRDGRAAPAGFRAPPGLAVFVLGESLRADALAVAGRGPWSDRLLARLDRGLGLRLPDACAAGNGTAVAAPRLLTMSDPADERTSREGPTLLAHAKAAGAATAWISAQESLIVRESGHDIVTQLSSSSEHGPHDDAAVLALRQFAETRRGRGARAALVHLLGQHFHYVDRYPADAFGAEPAGLSPSELEALRYGRAAEFGARVLVELGRLLDDESEPAFLVFTSDHGENLLVDGHGKRYHSTAPGQLDTRVPTLVLWNEAFAATGRTRLLDAFRAPALIAHRDVARLWLALAGGPQDVRPTPRPMTWTGAPRTVTPCDELKP